MLENHWIVYFKMVKMVHFMLCKFYLDLKKSKLASMTIPKAGGWWGRAATGTAPSPPCDSVTRIDLGCL